MAKREVIKEFASGTMSRAAFFSMIRSALRRKSMYWKPISECKEKSRRAYKGSNTRQKWEYKCNKCKKWFPDKRIVVDHITPAGELNDFNDLSSFVKNLFCEVDGLQVLCKECHDKKTIVDNKKTKDKRK